MPPTPPPDDTAARANNNASGTSGTGASKRTPGRLYLIPTPLMQPDDVSAAWLLEAERLQLTGITHFYVETPKTARRWLGKLGLDHPIQQLNLYPLPPVKEGKRHRQPDAEWLAPLMAGEDAGLLSDAGCPGVADPGALLVAAAHRQRIKVCPLVGPSSILLGLMASGFNGQQFAFHGYLPTAADERAAAIDKLARRSASLQETQLLIETPYRNQAMAEALIRHLPEKARLCIATDLTGSEQRIDTRSIPQWRQHPPQMPTKKPALFLFQI